MRKVLLIASLFALAHAGVVLAAGDATAGKTKSVSCAGCHGADGNSMVPMFPSLAGQDASYLLKQLMDFKSGKRQGQPMNAMVAPLSEQDMADLAAYYASQKPAKLGAPKGRVGLGKTIYRYGNAATGLAACAACHGPMGAGYEAARFPGLAGQHAPYLVAQLQKFAQGQRSNDPGSMMRMVARKMSAKEMQAVADYLQGLH